MITVKTSPHWQHCLNTVARPNRVATDAYSATCVCVARVHSVKDVCWSRILTGTVVAEEGDGLVE